MFDLLRPPLSDEQSLVIRTFVVEGNARAAAIELLVAVFASSPVEREQRSAAALKKAFAAIDRR